MEVGFETLLVVLCLFWLLVLTFFFIKFYYYYSRIVKSGKKESLVEILDSVIASEKEIKKDIDEIKKKCDKLESNGSFHIQKLGLLRFNPFKDTGGDQSFILTLLDTYNTGIVISSLHTRTGTRWYAKRVVEGKGIEYELSEDEQKALKESKLLHFKE